MFIIIRAKSIKQIQFEIMRFIEKSQNQNLPKLYYLISWKKYLKEENTQELTLAFQQFKNLIIFFYKNYLEKLSAIFKTINTIPPITRLIVKRNSKSSIKKSKINHSIAPTNELKRAKLKLIFIAFLAFLVFFEI